MIDCDPKQKHSRFWLRVALILLASAVGTALGTALGVWSALHG